MHLYLTNFWSVTSFVSAATFRSFFFNRSAETIRSEIQQFKSRYTFVRATDVCSICGVYLMSRPFHLFTWYLLKLVCVLLECKQEPQF